MENLTETTLLSPKGTFPAQIVNILDPYRLVMNRGERNRIQVGRRVLIYGISEEEIIDPNTGESLGFLELVRGTGRIILVQDKISIIESDKKPDIDLNKLYYLIREYHLLQPRELSELSYIPPLTPSGIEYLAKKELQSKRERELKSMIDKLGERLPFENPQVGDLVKPI
ncbi:hypothetical protein IQ232_12030 [Microcystis aeruginosa LEGE 11464]|jgi:hypothetical protein|uniref:Uncharacterized protein n=1 Tax=Microcystis aeruginosa PCC 9701 TaxID=721123 RepID=I4ITJ4_MICAE|nr:MULTISPECIES: hypothetical protein [Microcystis]MBE9090472.1 hypothetical protein [Microcystis aeruginosa LEGE 11464]MCA2654548.1 hypothetical protein [Microcystis sp. M061S2]MCZ8127539.1 hypothetical protein [Microcystis sp. LE19-114.1B]CCI37618.1 conserved hypothetical protein [Microcystis aeruginosa PCC 9701]